ncbi:MAG: trigger factor [Acidimicrobiales bacterium]
MRATAQPVEGNKVKLSVELDEEEIDKAVDQAFRKMAREVRVPGFRPGKVPRRLLEARVGAGTVRQEALRDSLPDFYARAVVDAEVDAIDAPEIDITAGEESGPVAFDATVEVRPTVSIAGYTGLAVTLPSLAVEDSDVDAQVDRLRDGFAELSVVGRPARDGDHLTIDIKASRNGQVIDGLTADDFVYELGTGSIVPEVDTELAAKLPGDILRFNAAVGEEEISFQVLVKEVKEKVLPEVTDEWVSEASEHETVEALRAELADRARAVRRVQARMLLQERSLEALVALVDIEPPDVLVNAEIERRAHDLGHRLDSQGATLEQYLAATGQAQDDLVAELRSSSITAVKADLALRALAEAEEISATDGDVDAEVARLAEQTGQSASRIRRQLEANEQIPAVRADARKGKALTWLEDHVELVDEAGKPLDRAELFPTSEAGADGEEAGGEGAGGGAEGDEAEGAGAAGDATVEGAGEEQAGEKGEPTREAAGEPAGVHETTVESPA